MNRLNTNLDFYLIDNPELAAKLSAPVRRTVINNSKWLSSIWRIIDEIRDDRAGEDWSKSVYMRTSTLLEEMPARINPNRLSELMHISGNASPLQGMGRFVGKLNGVCAAAAWRLTQSVYYFQPEVYEQVTQAEDFENLPSEVLNKLPEWATYIPLQLPGLPERSEVNTGFLIHKDISSNESPMVMLQLVHSNGLLEPLGSMEINQGESIKQAIGGFSRSDREKLKEIAAQASEINDLFNIGYGLDDTEFINDVMAGREVGQTPGPLAVEAINLCLFIVVAIGNTAGELPDRPKPIKRGRLTRYHPPKHARVWKVGAEFGERLRESQQPLSCQWGYIEEKLNLSLS